MSQMTREDRRDQLATLASGLCEDAEVQLELTEQREWGWDTLQRTLQVPTTALDDAAGLTYCAGILSREVGHYFLSRHHLFWVEFPSRRAVTSLLTALDQERVSTWITARYPGCGPWLDETALMPAGITPETPWFVQFCQVCAHEHRWGEDVVADHLPQPVQDAIEATREARREIGQVIPPIDLQPPENPELEEFYLEVVEPSMIIPQLLPSGWERTVQTYSLMAIELAEDSGILDIAAELLRRDMHIMERHLQSLADRVGDVARTGDPDALREMVQQAFAEQAQQEEPEAAPNPDGILGADVPIWMQFAAYRFLHSYIEHTPWMQRLIQPRDWRLGRFGRLPWLDRSNFRWSTPSDYNASYDEIADQIDELARRLSKILRPKIRMRDQTGYPSGKRVDLRRVMAFDADPRQYNKLWMRPTIPDRRHASVMLLVDLSGSMDGQKAQSALLGTILLAETLYRLDVSFAIYGFQDVLIELCAFNTDFDDAARNSIAEMNMEVSGSREEGNNRPEYNDDGPCLREAAGLLLDQPATSRILIVISDGLPEGVRSDTADLYNAVDEIKEATEISLIALGLGDNTEHVEDFYPNSVANIPTDKFTEEIAKLVSNVVM